MPPPVSDKLSECVENVTVQCPPVVVLIIYIIVGGQEKKKQFVAWIIMQGLLCCAWWRDADAVLQSHLCPLCPRRPIFQP